MIHDNHMDNNLKEILVYVYYVWAQLFKASLA